MFWVFKLSFVVGILAFFGLGYFLKNWAFFSNFLVTLLGGKKFCDLSS
jgi:hypothetical protein